MLFPSKEKAIEIALSNIPKNCEIIRVTDDEKDLGRAYCVPIGCWYIIYVEKIDQLLIIQSSSYIAISKIDGRVISNGSLYDEG